ncbi:hypothetical protein WKT05_05680 [Peptoniphilus sp. HCN-40583]
MRKADAQIKAIDVDRGRFGTQGTQRSLLHLKLTEEEEEWKGLCDERV